MGRCLSPCLGDLDPNLYRRHLDQALELLACEDGGEALLAHVEEQMRLAARELAFERAAWLRRRHGRLRALLGRLEGVLQATHARPRLVLAPHPRDAGRFDAFWLVGGRVADWGPVAGLDELEARTAVAAARAAGPPGWPVIPRDEVDEVRIVAAWLARNPDVPALALDPAPGRGNLEALLAQVSPTYQVPNISANSPKAGISTVR
jgi:DNA polymerase-3 subunit epsilon